MSPTVKVGPFVKDGTLCRTVAEGGNVFPEVWMGSAWVRGGELPDALPDGEVSHDMLAKFGLSPDGETPLAATALGG